MPSITKNTLLGAQNTEVKSGQKIKKRGERMAIARYRPDGTRHLPPTGESGFRPAAGQRITTGSGTFAGRSEDVAGWGRAN